MLLRWVTATHTLRSHSHYQTRGGGHLYQGRFKSLPAQDDEHFVVVCRYVERCRATRPVAHPPAARAKPPEIRSVVDALEFPPSPFPGPTCRSASLASATVSVSRLRQVAHGTPHYGCFFSCSYPFQRGRVPQSSGWLVGAIVLITEDAERCSVHKLLRVHL